MRSMPAEICSFCSRCTAASKAEGCPVAGRSNGTASPLLGRRVEAYRLLAAHVVNRQVARNAKQPGAELVASIVLAAALEDANPRLLKKVFGQIAAAGQVNQIAQQPVLIFLDQPIQQIGIATL